MRTLGRAVATFLSLAVSGVSSPPDACADEAASAAPDVVHTEILTVVHEKGITETVTLTASAPRNPGRWTLDLASEMKVVGVESEGIVVPFTAAEQRVTVDISKVHIKNDEPFTLVLRVEGSPREEQKSRHFVRSQVRPDLAYIRSQHPWYPRAADDPSTSRVTVDVPSGWRVRTAGISKGPERKGNRNVWTFERRHPGREVGLIAGPYVRVAGASTAGLALDALVLPGHEKAAGALLGVAKRAFQHYQDRFGTLRETQYGLVEVPKEFGSGSGYGEEGYVLLGAGAFDAHVAAWATDLVAHEIAHAWWGRTAAFRDFASEALANWSMLGFVAKERGEGAAREVRRRAVGRVEEMAAAGGEVSLSEVRGFGAGMDPRVYEALAYQKGMMLLVMVEQVLGEARMRDLLRTFLEASRGKTVGWTELRDAVCDADPRARAVVDGWTGSGLPSLRLDVESAKEDGAWFVGGTLTQSGTTEPRPMRVRVAALCGGKDASTIVDLTTAEASLRFATPGDAEAVVIDPDFFVLARREGSPDPEADRAFQEAFEVVNDPKDADPRHCGKALAALRDLVERGRTGDEDTCRVGIGRLLFRTGKLADAKIELETALRGGKVGPFHRSWARLRLGCIEDLAKERTEAVAHYTAVVELKGASAFVVQMARRFLETPYRGYDRDG